MFLHVSVILFTGRGGAIPACIAGGIPACLAARGCLLGGGVACGDPSPRKQTATVADGTHPTGMHSCFKDFYRLRTLYTEHNSKLCCQLFSNLRKSDAPENEFFSNFKDTFTHTQAVNTKEKRRHSSSMRTARSPTLGASVGIQHQQQLGGTVQ